MKQDGERSVATVPALLPRLRALGTHWVRVAANSHARLSAALVVYFPVMGLLGFGVVRGEISFVNPPTDCWPYIGEWGFISSACPVKAVNFAWFFFLGVPRIFLFYAAGVPATVAYHYDNDVIGQVLTILLFLAVLAFLFGPGIWLWWHTRRWVMWIAVPLLVAEVLVFGDL